MIIKPCILCGQPIKEQALISFDEMPASAQDIPDAHQMKEEHAIPLQLHQCSFCGLVQFVCEPVAYYRDVIRSGGFSTTMAELRRSQYGELITKYHLEGKRFIEVGCGRGEFLAVLDEFPVEAYGIEHKEDLVNIAREAGLRVWQGFTEQENQRLEEFPGQSPYDVFLSFNFLEHQPDPGKMLRCIYHNLTEHGMGLITVPSLEYILEHDGYYELIRDHLAYYTFDTLRYVLESNGFKVLEEQMVNRDTLSVIVKKIPGWNHSAQKFMPGHISAEKADVTGLKASLSIISAEVSCLIHRLHSENKTLAIWGASHQGFTLAATTGLRDQVDYIIDSAPFKQGRFAPASHIPIVAPDYAAEHPPAAILIVAPGYTKEIVGIIRERMGNQIQIFTLRSNHIEEIT